MTFNATPMVDVIFMLTIFFMLVTRFSSAEQKPMKLPAPEKSEARVSNLPQREIINCQLADPSNPETSDVLYSIGPNQPVPLHVLQERLIALRQDIPNLQVVVRADKRLRYDDVRAVMRVIARCGVEMLNVTAHVDEDE